MKRGNITIIAIIIASQVLINIAVVSGSIPPTGVPLPFISHGGTSLVVFMASIGVLLNISKQSKASFADCGNFLQKKPTFAFFKKRKKKLTF